MAIRHWPADERPREKLLIQGADTLSVAELLAILLRTGTKGKSAIDLAREMLQQFGGLDRLLSTDLQSFCQLSGLGKAKYIQLQASLELNRRVLFERLQDQNVLKNSEQTKAYLLAKLGHKNRETFACLFLNNQHQILGYAELFQGSINEADIYPREVMKMALHYNATALIIAHNHPSGGLQPSGSDRTVTLQLKRLLALIDIQLLDHIIIGRGRSLSFVEQGIL
ncbi:MAG: hypothetical protein A3E87_09605 [Gammaproteobacteria bacterium RIFCSPHIGHO2_12_FULL_35_23]|nr:MAG: hypothetical protein A3E87_09605 [Gammaproteobacteria bacterium RIFCSPHIGHO2_12_FULL_35_23]